MNRLDEALERLERAVLRLEAARGTGAAASDSPIARRLAECEAENRRLREAAGKIAARVDDTIAKVGEALAAEE